MISIDDILDMSDLTREEIAVLADHEHLADIAAAMLGEYLMHMHKGPQAVQKMICDDMRRALHADNIDEAKVLFATLQDFIADHPEAVRGSAPA
ncbi:hypothetical protein LA6_004505 [Marinibacterium anthonyi]|nr:hypothetical protein [Paracoccaceae bacterium]QEW22287.1 hypothetical protein LA6_004505 [Marinibacterium anthonyi]|tara:strand:- start:127 stop:408 length:282 start_codon:yes stop_codon:yes gene_type:complete